MAGKLENLEIDEVSGVDFPANKFNGWIVLKSKEGEHRVDVDEIIEAAQVLDAQATSVIKAHEDAADLFAKAPDEVKKAAEQVVTFLKGETEDAEEQTPKPGFLSRTIAALLGVQKQEQNQEEDQANEDEEAEQTPAEKSEVDWNAVIDQFRSGGSTNEE